MRKTPSSSTNDNKSRREFIKTTMATAAMAGLGGLPMNASAGESHAKKENQNDDNNSISTIKKSFDYVVVGGGSAGAVMASRLSENTTRSVLLIEAGEGYAANAFPPQLSRSDQVGGDDASRWPPTLQIGSDRPTGGLRAKVLGGGSTINAAAFIRAPESDFVRWTATGLKHWRYQDVLPFYKKSESADFGDDRWHGRHGPIPVHLRSREELTRSARDFIDAAVTYGLPYVDDLNVPLPDGVGIYPSNVKEGLRINTAIAYLPETVRQRTNLHILSSTLVDRVKINNGTAEAVVLSDNTVIEAGKVILCAGTIGTAAILLRSGIGPRAHMSQLGIPLVSELPVGQNLMDQPNVFIQVAVDGESATLPPIGGKVWTQTSEANGDELDIYLGFNHFTNPELTTAKSDFGVIVCNCRPASRGELQLDSSNAAIGPRVSLNLLENASDLERLTQGVELLMGLLECSPLKERNPRAMFRDGSEVPAGRKALSAAITRHVESTLHVTSSAPMGPKDSSTAVTDDAGRVYGVNELFVADASLFPDVPSVATNAVVIMAAEYIATRLKASATN
jgi:choline dehydrogenase